MRYISMDWQVVPKHCIYGPRPAEGIVFSNLEWWRITDHLVKDQKEKELAAAFKAKEEAKKELSNNMTRDWSNTLASIKTLGNQKRLESKEQEKQDKIDQYNAILKNQREENKKYCEQMRKLLAQEKDDAKTINKAIQYSLVLEEREKQLQRRAQKRLDEERKKQELADKIKKETEDYYRETEELRLQKLRDKRKLKEFLDKQLEEKRKRKQKEIEEFELCRQDLIEMREESERMQNCNLIEKRDRQIFEQKFLLKPQAQIDLRRRMGLEQEVEDEINQIYVNYDWLIRKERAVREEKIKNELIEQRTRISESLGRKITHASEAEEEYIGTGMAETEKREKKERQEELERAEKKRLSWLAGKKMAEDRRKREKYEAAEERKWVMMQRYKSAEVNEERNQAERMRVKQVQREVRRGLDCQMKELRERKAQELKEAMAMLANENIEKEDLEDYCQEVEDFSKEHNLPDYPIRAAIAKVRKINGLNDKKEQEQKQKEEEANNESLKQKSRTMGSGCYCLKY